MSDIKFRAVTVVLNFSTQLQLLPCLLGGFKHIFRLGFRSGLNTLEKKEMLRSDSLF